MAIAIGAFLNAVGILLGAILGMASRKLLPASTQLFFRNALGAGTILAGCTLVWTNISGTFLNCLKQISLAALAIILGNLLGKWLRLQKISNRLGHYAANLISAAQKNALRNDAEGFNACTILFCAAPLGIVGAIVDGLSGFFWLLAIKAAMDALAMTAFVKIFRWPSAMSAFAVLLFFGAITFICQFYAAPFLNSFGLMNSVNMAAGFIALAVSIVVFGVRKVELANYLPALVVAPLLVWFLK